jgi:hypothetical protein
MFSYFMPQGFGVGDDETPELIYFGASTKDTILGLAGSASYVFTRTDGRMTPLSSAIPFLAHVIARKSGVRLSHPFFNNPDNNDVITALSAMEYMEEYNRKEDQLQSYSFFAKVKLNKVYSFPGEESKRFVIASPLYVAHAD